MATMFFELQFAREKASFLSSMVKEDNEHRANLKADAHVRDTAFEANANERQRLAEAACDKRHAEWVEGCNVQNALLARIAYALEKAAAK